MNSELNLRTKEIQKCLIAQLKFTPRRQLFEEQNSIARNEEAEKTKIEACGSKETEKSFNWSLLIELREFREKYSNECMSIVNRRRFQREREKENEFLGKFCNLRVGSSFVDDEKTFCEAPGTSKSPPKMKTLRFAPENSLALSHQKFKY